MKPSHPGAILGEDILKEMSISITKAAQALHLSRKQLSKILNDSNSISPEMAIRLEKGFGVDARFCWTYKTNTTYEFDGVIVGGFKVYLVWVAPKSDRK